MNRLNKLLLVANLLALVVVGVSQTRPAPKLEAKLTYSRDPRVGPPAVCFAFVLSECGADWVVSQSAVPCEAIPPHLLSPWFGVPTPPR